MARMPYGLVNAKVEGTSSSRHQISIFKVLRKCRGPTYVYLIIFGVMNVFWYSLLSWCLSSGACYSSSTTSYTVEVNKDIHTGPWQVKESRRIANDDIVTTLKSIAPTNTTVTNASTVTMATANTSATSPATTNEEVTTEATEVVTTVTPNTTTISDKEDAVEEPTKPEEIMCKTVCPPITWGEWSICSKHCGGGRRFRHATYEFVCTNSELCPPNKIEEEACNTNECVVKDDYGPIIPYPNNPLNPAIHLEKSVNFSCGTWVSEYTQLHNDILAGKKPPKYLIYTTGKSGGYPPAGGLGDRLRGITTLFYLAVATGNHYYMYNVLGVYKHWTTRMADGK